MRPVHRGIKALVIALPLWAASFFLFPAFAETSAEDYVRGLRDDMVAVLDDTAPRSAERDVRLRHLFIGAFDASTIAEAALGRHWPSLRKDERERYVRAVPEYLATVYASWFADYRSQTFEVVGARDVEGPDTTVETVVRGSGLTRPMAIGVQVRQGEAGFRIRDVTVGGISMLSAKRDEFDSFLRRENAATLIAVIEEFTAGD